MSESSSDRLKRIIAAISGRPYEVGDRIMLVDDLEMEDRPYFTGHEFVLESRTERGWNVMDDNGNRIEDLSGKWFTHSRGERQ